MFPKYEELPRFPGSDLRHAWDVFGRGDRLGTLTRQTPDARRHAAQLIRHGILTNLSLPVTEPAPPLFGRPSTEHVVYPTSSFSWDDRLDALALQGSTQWDGFLHVRHKEFGFYGGRLHRELPDNDLGIHHWVEHGITGRGVLVDLATHLRANDPTYDPWQPRSVTPAEILEAGRAQDVELRPGDILCLRFGWLERFNAAHTDERARAVDPVCCAGLSAGAETAAFLWDTGISALACDNPTVEVQPGDKSVGYLHHRLLTMLGMPLGELFDLGALATTCRTLGTWEFFFLSSPLHVRGGVGAPANAVALH